MIKSSIFEEVTFKHLLQIREGFVMQISGGRRYLVEGTVSAKVLR